MTEVRLPKPGDAIDEAEITKFLIEEGATVSEGDPLYSLATDKVEMDIEAPSSGTVAWKVEEGGTYDIGTLVAVIS
ncbi:dihydrolipoamide acyltransferase [Mycobacterium paraffinicum]|uniref:Dihydrolipoamide acyltransferase n=1 Tax=Mycobacterium paraffinicum TaxID=53378 RepID=A0A1Q4HN74_9MYCO|nr:lipoyl domain-containing protein [Mycobacterium paraffinicum]OJZ68988.1 dihydrolipoamide acyltransferase [Mycobacterium paraffinicum]